MADQNMSVPVTNGGHMIVVTQVQPVTVPAPAQGNNAFSRGYPLSLGTTQIMIGVIVLLFGLVMTLAQPPLAVYTGIFVWGAIVYITAGSLTVAAGKYDTRCLVNGAMAVSIVSAFISLTAAVLHSLDATGVLIYCHDYYMCYSFSTLSQGFSGILAVFDLLMMAVSITVSAFACNTTCSSCNPPPPPTHVVVQQVPKAINPIDPPPYS